MAKTFELARVGKALMPEALAVAGLAGGHVVARGLDAAFALERPFRRISDWGHVLALFASGYMIAKDAAPNVARALFYADEALLATSFGDWLYIKAMGPQTARVRARRMAEQITKRGGGNPGLTAAEKQALMDAARVRTSGSLVRQYANDEIRA